MTVIVDKIYFLELAEQDPKDVCKRVLCKYNEENNSYTISVWGDEYSINPQEFKIDPITDFFPKPHNFFYLFIIYYLLKAKEIELSNEWISEKDIPGGATFFRGPHEVPGYLITKRYGNDINAFKKRCEQLNGIPLDMGDAAFSFTITSCIQVAVIYWKGDDEFPPEAKIVYDKTITEHLSSDIIFALAVEICSRVGSINGS